MSLIYPLLFWALDAIARSKLTRRLPILLPALLVTACSSVQYYAQAVSGHLDIVARERPIKVLLADHDTAADLRRKLDIVLEVRRFATAHLGLPDTGSYLSYADLERPYVAWNVFAAAELSLKPHEWCFPFAGCVSYRAYFSKADALAYAAELARTGDDVYIAGTQAYSTLGWFADPVLNTFIQGPDLNIPRLIFHELAHQKLYVKNDSAFNEGFAVAVEREGLRRWVNSEGNERSREELRRQQGAEDRMIAEILNARAQLADVYAQPITDQEKRIRKAAVYVTLQERLRALGVRGGGFGGAIPEQRLNNAYLVAASTYYQYVPAFDALLAEKGGDLSAFYRAVAMLGELPKPERQAQLQALGNRAIAARQDDLRPQGS